MRLNSNPLAMNTIRNMLITGSGQATALQRLSSGKRLNRSADDAAGYAISEKMALQAAGLRRASKNSLDGISMIQTAEAALNEVHSILQRMRELAVQASNDSNILEDRKSIQNEINQLTSEINRIGESTEFNKMKMFTADNEDGTAKSSLVIPVQVGSNANQMVDIPFQVVSSTALGISGIERIPPIRKTKTTGGKAIDVEKVSVSPTSGKTVDKNIGLDTNNIPVLSAKYADDNPLVNRSVKKRGVNNIPTDDNGNNISINSNVGFKYLEEYALDVTNHEAASSAIKVYDNAIAQISQLRATLGASQNRLEHTITSLDAAQENVTEAMSRIQDANMAEEMSEFTKYNVLQQSGTAMLSQINQLPQMVLRLLEQ